MQKAYEARQVHPGESNVVDRDAEDTHGCDIHEILVEQTGIFEQSSKRLSDEFSAMVGVQMSYQTS